MTALQGPVMQARLYSMASGTTVIGIKSSELQKLSIEVPDYPTQCAIAETLGSFDDKIDCNRRINDLLLNMARALFPKSGVKTPRVQRLSPIKTGL